MITQLRGRWTQEGKRGSIWDPDMEGSDLLNQERASGRILEEMEYWAASEPTPKAFLPEAADFLDDSPLSL